MTRDIPIIFSAPMILALLDGRKTMTRRLAYREAKPAAKMPFRRADKWFTKSLWQTVKPGDRLWVKETWANVARPGYEPVIFFRADDDTKEGHATPPGTKWKSGRFMPRKASRLTLIVTATKIERVQDISEEDALADGVVSIDKPHPFIPEVRPHYTITGSDFFATARSAYSALWNDLHGHDSWTANQEVVAITFRVIKANIDTL